MNEINIWSGGTEEKGNSKELSIPQLTIAGLVKYANVKNLSDDQQNKIVKAFGIEAYDMGAAYAWRRAMSVLREEIATLGMQFVGEMLNRDDIEEFSSPETVLTDYDTISLADQLGIVNKTGALKLRQALELINHFFSKDADEELDLVSAVNIVAASVQSVLSHGEIAIAVEFTQFRKRLQTESLAKEDAQLLTIAAYPLFYVRTVLTVLLGSAKSAKSATLEHSLENLNVFLPIVWEKLAEKDKWNVGMTYRDVVTDGNEKSAIGLKRALMKVKGFDFVPETLRSDTFRKTAKAVITTHFAYNNFYNEPAVVSRLAKLGSTIPEPAFQDCMDAYLLVYLGTLYGVSDAAAPIAKKELTSLPVDRWVHFFNNIIAKDDKILDNITHQGQLSRFSKLLNAVGEDTFEDLNEGIVKRLYEAIRANDINKYTDIRRAMLSRIR